MIDAAQSRSAGVLLPTVDRVRHDKVISDNVAAERALRSTLDRADALAEDLRTTLAQARYQFDSLQFGSRNNTARPT